MMRDFQPKSISRSGNIMSLAKQFLSELGMRGYAKNTISSYQIDLEQFVGFMAGQGLSSLPMVSAILLDDWVNSMLTGQGVSVTTMKRKIATIRRFYLFAVKRGVLTERENPTVELGRDLRSVKSRIEAPSEEFLLKLIDSFPSDTPLGKRNQFMVYLMLLGALRRNDVVNIDVYNENEIPERGVILPSGKFGTLHFVSKGGESRQVNLDARCRELYLDYLSVRHRLLPSIDHKSANTDRYQSDRKALFLSAHRRRITPVTVYTIIKNQSSEIGLRIHPHLIRHCRLRSVTGVAGIQAAFFLSGHAHMSTTMNEYSVEEGEKMRSLINEVAPIGGSAQ